MTLKVLCMIDSFSIKDEETGNIQRNAWNETDYGIVILTEFWEIRFKCKIINIDSPWDSFTTFFLSKWVGSLSQQSALKYQYFCLLFCCSCIDAP